MYGLLNHIYELYVTLSSVTQTVHASSFPHNVVYKFIRQKPFYE